MRQVLRLVGSLAAGATALGSLAFALLYMARWEWGRALVAGIVFVAAEVALGFIAVLRRLDHVSDAPSDRHVRRAAPRRRDPSATEFPWLASSPDRFGVFIPLLLGGGVLVSGVTWAIEKFSSATDAGPRPQAYDRFAFPDRPLVPSDTEVRVRGLGQQDDEQLRALLGPFASGDPP